LVFKGGLSDILMNSNGMYIVVRILYLLNNRQNVGVACIIRCFDFL
jgi:hypothetical protein